MYTPQMSSFTNFKLGQILFLFYQNKTTTLEFLSFFFFFFWKVLHWNFKMHGINQLIIEVVFKTEIVELGHLFLTLINKIKMKPS